MASKVCKKFGVEKPEGRFPKDGNGGSSRRSSCSSCKYKEEKPRDMRAYQRAYYRRPHRRKAAVYKSYKHRDKTLGRQNDLTFNTFRALVDEPCSYCTRPHSGGLDRIDNALGHETANVRPCCERCNNILGDLPDAVKHLLKDGLKTAFLQGLLESWQIPTKRTTRRSSPPSKRRGDKSDTSLSLVPTPAS